jgi:hypothetical protein
MSELAKDDNIKPGDDVTMHLWTDAHSYTVVRVTKKFVEVRANNEKIDPTWKREFIPGGFAGHTPNNYSQKWIVEKNPDAPIVKFGVRKDGYLCSKGSRRPDITLGAHPFYDYNF